MRGSLKVVANMLILAAVALGCAGIVASTGTSRVMADSGQLVVEGDSPSFGEVPVGSEPVVNVRLRNRTSGPIRLLGANSVCQKVACLNATNLPQSIPAGAIGVIVIHVKTQGVGDFAGSFDVFTDRAGRTAFPIKVRGNVVQPTPSS